MTDANIRPAQSSDACNLLDLLEKLDSETQFMIFEAGERNTTEAEQVSFIQEFARVSNQLMAVADFGDHLGGFIVATGGTAWRSNHTAHIILGIEKSHWRQGLGRALIDFMEGWATQHDIHRIEFTVMAHNEAARQLYQSCGYQEEGIRQHSLKIGEAYIDEIYMAKLLQSSD